MADISGYVRQIQVAARGEEVRDALIDSLNAMNQSISPSVESALIQAKNSQHEKTGGERWCATGTLYI